MASFPKIDSPCPLRWQAMPTDDRNFCTQCERKVHNLDAMNDAQRREFLSGCDGSVCVAYTLKRPAVARGASVGLGLAAVLALSPAMALAQAQEQITRRDSPATSLTPTTEFVDCDENSTDKIEFIVVTGGGIANPREATWLTENEALPLLPEVGRDAFLDQDSPAEFVAEPVANALPD